MKAAAAQRLIPVLVICAGLYAYHNSLQAPFIFDDLVSIPPTQASVISGHYGTS